MSAKCEDIAVGLGDVVLAGGFEVKVGSTFSGGMMFLKARAFATSIAEVKRQEYIGTNSTAPLFASWGVTFHPLHSGLRTSVVKSQFIMERRQTLIFEFLAIFHRCKAADIKRTMLRITGYGATPRTCTLQIHEPFG
jgi:hypothetical protein